MVSGCRTKPKRVLLLPRSKLLDITLGFLTLFLPPPPRALAQVWKATWGTAPLCIPCLGKSFSQSESGALALISPFLKFCPPWPWFCHLWLWSELGWLLGYSSPVLLKAQGKAAYFHMLLRTVGVPLMGFGCRCFWAPLPWFSSLWAFLVCSPGTIVTPKL